MWPSTALPATLISGSGAWGVAQARAETRERNDDFIDVSS
jgi:hypothetical protein